MANSKDDSVRNALAAMMESSAFDAFTCSYRLSANLQCLIMPTRRRQARNLHPNHLQRAPAPNRLHAHLRGTHVMMRVRMTRTSDASAKRADSF